MIKMETLTKVGRHFNDNQKKKEIELMTMSQIAKMDKERDKREKIAALMK